MKDKILVSVRSLSKHYSLKGGSVFESKKRVYANSDISLDILRGETLGLVGESGSGKSTFGRCVLGLTPIDSGSVRYYGTDVYGVYPDYVKKAMRAFLSSYDSSLKKVKSYLDKRKNSHGYGYNDDFGAYGDEWWVRESIRVLGGLSVCDEGLEGCELVRKRFEVCAGFKKKTDLNKAYKAEGFTSENGTRIDADYNASVRSIDAKIERIKRECATKPYFMEAEGEIDRGIELTRMKGEQMRKLRKEMQIVLQDPYSSLNPRMTVEEIIAEGIIAHGIMKQGSSELSDHIRATLELSGMPSSMLSRYPHEFSGGQRQRISIARALALSPKLIVCDECVSALDVSVGAQIINLLSDLKEREGLTYLFISHDLSVVRYISDRVGVMYLGRIVELGRAEEIFDHPRHPYTEALLSAAPGIGKKRILFAGTNASASPTEAHEGCPYATRCRMATDRCRIERPLLEDLGDGHLCACHHAL